ncbi:hypothetical protein ANANG_G00307430 [Anguilla anguilla]|uniref:Uncharacterized protein n=1 Tax=Anguilla anguilla TaxID=7936 RepID=A0A9D3RHD2_ANGAN|nr:hypothetical protein ANANG_G00307430 [Anguilla anguilla]
MVKRKECMPEIYVLDNEKKCNMVSLSVKKVYGRLIVIVIKEPAAERVWRRVFENMDVKKIWSNGNIKYNRIECENNDFLIKHKCDRIYTNVVLNKINNESFLHYFFDCNDLVDFFGFLKKLLKENWCVQLDLEEGWRKLFLFGVFEKSKTVNFCLINFVLSHARLAVVYRRNYVHFEGRKVNVKCLFKSLMKRDVEFICKHGSKEFFVSGNKLIYEGERREIVFNW